MKRTLILVILGMLAVPILAGFWLVGARNGFVRTENRISALDGDMKNVHASIYRQMEAQGVAVDKYGDIVIEAINAGMSGRYGDDGVKGAMLWIHEQNPTIDAAIMLKLQQAIEVGYNKFEAKQREKIDVVRTYKDQLGSFPSNVVASTFGFPRIDMAAAERVISSATTKADFEAGELSAPNLSRPKE